MTEIGNILTIIFVVAGTFFMLVGSIGVVRLPDFFTRSHATSKSDTLGIMLVLGGLAIFEGLTLTGIKLVLVVFFVALANPAGSHALARSALFFGIKPWFKGEPEQRGKGE
ncbi:MAG: monovalent cation/H(+) antiporter subunit G [Ignavibacteriaceae bacterium]